MPYLRADLGHADLEPGKGAKQWRLGRDLWELPAPRDFLERGQDMGLPA